MVNMMLNKIYPKETIAKSIAEEMIAKSFKVIGVTGTSCVGKSTFTSMIQTRLACESFKTQVINVDDYLKEEYRAETRFWNRKDSVYLKPEYFDWQALAEDVKRLQAGETVVRKHYTRGIGWQTEITCVPTDYLIVEGLFLDSEETAEYLKFEHLICMYADDELITKMRVARDAYYRNNYENFQRTESETLKEIENTLMAGKSYRVSKDIDRYLKLKVLENHTVQIDMKID